MSPERKAKLRSHAPTGSYLDEALAALEVAEALLAGVHIAAPAAIGDNVLRFAPAGPVLLTSAQRADIRRQLAAQDKRISDLKFAMGDNAGWFDRFTAERARAEAAEARAAEGERALTMLQCVLDLSSDATWNDVHAATAQAKNDTAMLREYGEADAARRSHAGAEHAKVMARSIEATEAIEERARVLALSKEGGR